MNLREKFLSDFFHRATLYKILLLLVFLVSVEIILHVFEIVIDLAQANII